MWRNNSLLLLIAAAVLSPTVAWAGIVITPAAPTTGSTVTIRLENSFGAQAQLISASITQTGNNFVIQQNVEIACTLPSAPIVASEFQVGPLAPGLYSVTGNITFTGIGPLPCSPAPITQTSSFTVAPSTAIPALSPSGMLLLAGALAAAAVVVLRSQQ